jgi:5-(carboxyamino)imidazole ribonucleotide synthase
MLIEAGVESIGMSPSQFVILSRDRLAPARRYAAKVAATAEDFVQLLGGRSARVLIETENLDLAPFLALEPLFFPPLPVVRLLQDKLEQKKLCTSLKIPTSTYFEVTSLMQFQSLVAQGSEWVLKASLGGYDGKGTLLPSRQTEELVEKFLISSRRIGARVYAEEFVPFRRELAMVGWAMEGQFLGHYALVETEQENGVCKVVRTPASLSGSDFQEEAKHYLRLICEELKFGGVFAVEFFETQDGSLLVNEMAPRVHNSGHITQDLQGVRSQFHTHLELALGRRVEQAPSSERGVMWNLLGFDSGRADLQSFSEAVQLAERLGGRIHWYGKAQSRPGRKLGHINFVGNCP